MLDFISYNRLDVFVKRLALVATTQSAPYVDNSPDGIFTSPKGTILQKKGNILSYKYPGDSTFTVINYASDSIRLFLERYTTILNSGINKNVIWIKTDDDPVKTWKNRGVSLQSCEICEIVPAPPCTPTPYPTPTPYGFDELVTDTLVTENIYVQSPNECPPTETTPGETGEIMICENYMYVYDGIEWKRFELSIYF